MSIQLPVAWLSIQDALPGPAWRIVDVELMPDSVICRTQTCKDGQAFRTIVEQTWPVNEHEEHWTEVKDATYGANVATYDWVQGTGSVFLEGRDGHGPMNYRVVDGNPSDKLCGVGLPEARHIGVRVVFEFKGAVPPPAPPAPVPNDTTVAQLAKEIAAAKVEVLHLQECLDAAAALVEKLKTP